MRQGWKTTNLTLPLPNPPHFECSILGCLFPIFLALSFLTSR